MSHPDFNKGVSVILCCHNSACRLQETLKYIALQEVAHDIQWEVILVNNNSTDNTVEVAEQYWAKYNSKIPFKTVNAPITGLSNARKKGIYSSRFEIIVFCDDDNWLSRNYIQTSYEVMQNNFSIGILGGDSFSVCEVPPPSWFEENKRDYAVGPQGKLSGDATYRWFIWGAGMVIRKSLIKYLLDIGVPSFLNDRKGTELSAGGDNEICKWYILAGYKLWYDNRLIIKHFIPKERLTESYFKRMWIGFENTDYWLGRYDILIHIKKEKRSRAKNMFLGLKYLIRNKKSVFVIKNIDMTRTYIQFLIGPVVNISSKEEFRLIKVMYPLLYKNISGDLKLS
jgi:glycosyltransferase involved in cell wall biosynthesis